MDNRPLPDPIILDSIGALSSPQTSGAGSTFVIEPQLLSYGNRHRNSGLNDAERKAKRAAKKAERNRKRDQRRKQRR